MTVADVQVPEAKAIEHIDWEFLRQLQALESAIDPSVLSSNVVEDLRIDEQNINQELEQQPAKFFQFSAIAIRMKKILSLYESTLLRQYHAHVHRYAQMCRKANGEKDTLDGVKETAVMAFSGSVTEDQRLLYANLALRGSKLNTMTMTKLQQYIDSDAARWTTEVRDLLEHMYPPNLSSYEDIVTQHENMKEKKELADSLAKSFEKRSFAVSSIASNMRSSGGEADGIRLRGTKLTVEGMKRLKHIMEKNPAASDVMLVDIMNAFE